MPTPARGTHPRIARQHSRARLAATPEEHEHLDALVYAIETGAIPIPEAERLLTALLRTQNERTRRAA